MKKNIFVLLFLSIIICSQNIYSTNTDDPSEEILQSSPEEIFLEQNHLEENKQLAIKNFNETIKNLSTKLDYMLEQIENKDEKQAVVKLIQYIQNGKDVSEWQNNQDDNNSNNKKRNNNSSSIGKEVINVIKRLTSPTAIVVYATVICFMITKNILLSGEITKTLIELKEILGKIAQIEKWRVIGNIGNYASYVLKAIVGYLSIGYYKSSYG